MPQQNDKKKVFPAGWKYLLREKHIEITWKRSAIGWQAKEAKQT